MCSDTTCWSQDGNLQVNKVYRGDWIQTHIFLLFKFKCILKYQIQNLQIVAEIERCKPILNNLSFTKHWLIALSEKRNGQKEIDKSGRTWVRDKSCVYRKSLELLFIPFALNASQITFYTCCVLGGPNVLIHYVIAHMVWCHTVW